MRHPGTGLGKRRLASGLGLETRQLLGGFRQDALVLGEVFLGAAKTRSDGALFLRQGIKVVARGQTPGQLAELGQSRLRRVGRLARSPGGFLESTLLRLRAVELDGTLPGALRSCAHLFELLRGVLGDGAELPVDRGEVHLEPDRARLGCRTQLVDPLQAENSLEDVHAVLGRGIEEAGEAVLRQQHRGAEAIEVEAYELGHLARDFLGPHAAIARPLFDEHAFTRSRTR